jgi:hypothetical protein
VALALAASPFACGLEVTGKASADAGLETGTATPPMPAADAAPPSPCGDILASKDNCGACGHACTASSCANGVCESELIAEGLGQTRSVALTRTRVLFTRAGINPAIMAIALEPPDGGGPPEALVSAVAPTVLSAIAEHPSYPDIIAWFTAPGATGVTLVTGGGIGTPNETFGPGVGIFSGSTGAYWTLEDGRLLMTDLSFTTPQYFGATGGIGQGVAGDDTFVYWANPETGIIQRVTGSGPVELFRFGEDHPTTIALDGDWIYFTTATEVRRTAKTLGAEVTTLAKGLGGPVAIALDEEARLLYWIDVATGDLKRVPVEGGTPLTLARGSGPLPDFPYTRLVALSGKHVYWLSPRDGTLRRLAK